MRLRFSVRVAKDFDALGAGDDRRARKADEKPVFDDAGDRRQDLAQRFGLSDRAKRTVKNIVAAVGDERRGFAAQDASAPASPSCAKARSICRLVAARPNGTTSIGNGNAPSRGTSLVESAMTTMRFEAEATIFSRNSAPPPPLISLSLGSTSSAPSTVRSSSGMSSSVPSGMPSAFACASVASEVATQRS